MSEEIPKTLSAARAALQAEIVGVRRTETANAGKYQYDYAPLGEVLRQTQDARDRLGLEWSDHFEINESGGLCLRVTLCHVDSGEAETSTLPVPPSLLSAPQNLGSYHSYLRRYMLLGLLGLAWLDTSEDDDGASAQKGIADAQKRNSADVINRALADMARAKSREECEQIYRTIPAEHPDRAAVAEAAKKRLTELADADKPKDQRQGLHAAVLRKRIQTARGLPDAETRERALAGLASDVRTSEEITNEERESLLLEINAR